MGYRLEKILQIEREFRRKPERQQDVDLVRRYNLLVASVPDSFSYEQVKDLHEASGRRTEEIEDRIRLLEQENKRLAEELDRRLPYGHRVVEETEAFVEFLQKDI
ncbi:hypothetical protein COV15_03470 [Candidatus Woesearchaeota archaeon CG10_big_fil_rev_8_21_14_0_10_34_12]|nr:MAG: hypothetical protein COV15_03470 [Candidatus Woesearchaeota archaeon CG10_big_fil_rev_8_21_14_0_10_34_12]